MPEILHTTLSFSPSRFPFSFFVAMECKFVMSSFRSGQKGLYLRDDACMGVFQNIVAGIWVLTDVCIREALPPLLKEYGIKTPVFHAPADFHGLISQPVE